MGFSHFAREWVPPVITAALKGHLPGRIRFEGGFTDWATACARAGGYSDSAILDRVLRAALLVKAGQAAYERDSVCFQIPRMNAPVLAALMWAAARCNGSLHVMDFGGSLGSTYFQHRMWLQALRGLRWTVVEQPQFVAAGQAHLQDDALTFVSSPQNVPKESPPNALLFSSVLQYLESPQQTWEQLISLAPEVVVVDRTPFSAASQDRVFVQHVPPSIYKASYPMWVLSEERWQRLWTDGYQLVASFSCDEGVFTVGSLRFEFKGFVLSKGPR